ncbi:MAG: glycosyltransferase family 2 protein [Thermoanaerobaculia bacterium]
MTSPRVSVVSAVFNGERYLRQSLESVLSQQSVDLEFIVIDDGSTDATSSILADFARRDPRLRVLTQDNKGLTQALILGCAEARGEFIARHDLDDVSLPGRLARQAALLEADTDLAFISCWAHVIGPKGELLYEEKRPIETSAVLRRFGDGPSAHGSVMMRRAAYERAGGYRSQFRLGQDWDLWWRLFEIGGFAVVPMALYTYRFHESGVSANRRREQERFGELGELCASARKRGQPENALLEEAERLSRDVAARARSSPAGGDYFIGRSLLRRQDPGARTYLWRCVRREPWRLKAWVSLLQTALPWGRPR